MRGEVEAEEDREHELFRRARLEALEAEVHEEVDAEQEKAAISKVACAQERDIEDLRSPRGGHERQCGKVRGNRP